MAIDTKEIYSAISRAQGEMTQAHFELVSIYLYEGQNSKYKDCLLYTSPSPRD